MLQFVNWRMRVTIADNRTLLGTFMAFDRHMNIVLGDCEEYRKVRGKKASEEKEEKRSLGLVLLRGENVISLQAESPPPPKPRAQAVAAGRAGPGVGRAAGRGIAATPLGQPLGQAPQGLAGPVRGMGGPAPQMMLPVVSAQPVPYAGRGAGRATPMQPVGPLPSGALQGQTPTGTPPLLPGQPANMPAPTATTTSATTNAARPSPTPVPPIIAGGRGAPMLPQQGQQQPQQPQQQQQIFNMIPTPPPPPPIGGQPLPPQQMLGRAVPPPAPGQPPAQQMMMQQPMLGRPAPPTGQAAPTGPSPTSAPTPSSQAQPQAPQPSAPK